MAHYNQKADHPKSTQHEKTALATKNLPALPAPLQLAKKMGEGLAGGEVLFHRL